jgi:DNA-binding response OmpR family regulator
LGLGEVDLPNRGAAAHVPSAIIEQDEELAGRLLDGLATRGHSARWFQDGTIAAAALAGPAPEVTARVVLLDPDLPGLGGPTVLGRLAEARLLAGSQVIVLTRAGDEADAHAALAAGAFDQLQKLVSASSLLRTIRLALRAAPPSPSESASRSHRSGSRRDGRNRR